MPKLKTKGSLKKRFKRLGNGKLKMAPSGKRHGMSKRSKKFIRKTRGMEVMSRSDLMRREVPMNITFQINAIDTANMEEMLENRRGSIISMIRGAANEHGQDFLEMIDTDTYNEDQRVAGGPLRSYE